MHGGGNAAWDIMPFAAGCPGANPGNDDFDDCNELECDVEVLGP